MPQAKVLIADEDKVLCTALRLRFISHGFDVRCVNDGLQAAQELHAGFHDLALLSQDLSGTGAVELCQRFRQHGGVSIVIITSSEVTIENTELILDAGADAYVNKPFEIRELIARVKSLLRRTGSNRFVHLGPFILDGHLHVIQKDHCAIDLRPMEFKLLQLLLEHPGEVLTAQELWDHIWQQGGPVSDTVRTHIKTIRKKIDSQGSPSFIQTVTGRGYKFDDMSRN